MYGIPHELICLLGVKKFEDEELLNKTELVCPLVVFEERSMSKISQLQSNNHFEVLLFLIEYISEANKGEFKNIFSFLDTSSFTCRILNFNHKHNKKIYIRTVMCVGCFYPKYFFNEMLFLYENKNTAKININQVFIQTMQF